jgi:hypothetical protein
VNKAAIISEYFSSIGKIKTRKKTAAVRQNIRAAHAARRAPVARLEAAFRAVRDGKMPLSRAAVDVGQCSYYTLRKYVARREKGETMKQIEASPSG